MGKDYLHPWQIKRLELGLGCENCGNAAKRRTRFGRRYCGDRDCANDLDLVDLSARTPVLTPEELRDVLRESI